MPPVYEAIRKASREGNRNCYLPNVKHPEQVKHILRGLGYEIKHYEGDYRDPRDFSYDTINW